MRAGINSKSRQHFSSSMIPLYSKLHNTLKVTRSPTFGSLNWRDEAPRVQWTVDESECDRKFFTSCVRSFNTITRLLLIPSYPKAKKNTRRRTDRILQYVLLFCSVDAQALDSDAHYPIVPL